MSKHHGDNGFLITVDCLLEINRPDLLCYLFAGPPLRGDKNKTLPHFDMDDGMPDRALNIWDYVERGLSDHDIPSRFPIKQKPVLDHRFKADHVVRTTTMSWGKNTPGLSVEDLALVEKAMRIGLSGCGAEYACGGCENTFQRHGIYHALKRDIMKEAG